MNSDPRQDIQYTVENKDDKKWNCCVEKVSHVTFNPIKMTTEKIKKGLMTSNLYERLIYSTNK